MSRLQANQRHDEHHDDRHEEHSEIQHAARSKLKARGQATGPGRLTGVEPTVGERRPRRPAVEALATNS